MDNLKTLHDRWIKNRSCIHFSISIRLLDGKIQAELKDAPPQYKKALLSMMEMIMSNGVLYIKAAYHDAIRKKGLDVNEKKVHDDLDLRLVPLIDMLINGSDMEKFCRTVEETAYIFATRLELDSMVFTADGWKKTSNTESVPEKRMIG